MDYLRWLGLEDEWGNTWKHWLCEEFRQESNSTNDEITGTVTFVDKHFPGLWRFSIAPMEIFQRRVNRLSDLEHVRASLVQVQAGYARLQTEPCKFRQDMQGSKRSFSSGDFPVSSGDFPEEGKWQPQWP